MRSDLDQDHRDQYDTAEKILVAVSFGLLMVHPFLPGLDLLYPKRVAGFSLFITFIPTLVLAV